MDETCFQSGKPQLGQQMLGRALEAGLHPRWVLADAVYGSDDKTRRFLEDHGQPYVLAVRSQQRLWVEFKQVRVDALASSGLMTLGGWQGHEWDV